jgi:hypothetical protein
MLKIGWIGWIGWIGLMNSRASSIHPRALSLDWLDHRPVVTPAHTARRSRAQGETGHGCADLLAPRYLEYPPRLPQAGAKPHIVPGAGERSAGVTHHKSPTIRSEQVDRFCYRECNVRTHPCFLSLPPLPVTWLSLDNAPACKLKTGDTPWPALAGRTAGAPSVRRVLSGWQIPRWGYRSSTRKSMA